MIKLFEDNHKQVRYALASNPEAPKSELFAKFFEDPDVNVRIQASKNPTATILKNYHKLFSDPSFKVKRIAKSREKEYNEIWNPKLDNDLKFKPLFETDSVIQLDLNFFKKKRKANKYRSNLKFVYKDSAQLKITRFI